SGYIPTFVGHVKGDFITATARASYSSKNLVSQLYYVSNIFDGNLTIPLVFNGLHLADFKPAKAITHNADGEIQWTLPSFWKPLMIIAGGRARLSWFGCPNCLDSDFANPESPRYHQEGTSYLELRAGGFVHAELTPLDVLALNGSLRADFNTATGFFLSPRLAAVIEVAERHHLRISAARAFRKPSFLEKGLHVDVEFPTDSAIVPADRMLFREFLSRVIGNPDLGNEKLWAFELGYQWRPAPFFVELDLYTNLYSDFSWVQSRIVTDSRGLPDLRRSSFRFEKADYSTVIMGAELQFGWQAIDWLRLELALATFGVWQDEFALQEDGSPKFLFSLGAEWNHPMGIRGSLFLSGRSEFKEHNIENPAGLLEPTLSMKVANSLLIQGRIGWTTEVGNTKIEAGSKLYVPFTIDPVGWGMYDRAGGVTPEGRLYGGTILLPTLLFYLSAEY
ncbi:MAG: TonB-dependent receptor, partial [Deltaproteobacteria bacterium]